MYYLSIKTLNSLKQIVNFILISPIVPLIRLKNHPQKGKTEFFWKSKEKMSGVLKSHLRHILKAARDYFPTFWKWSTSSPSQESWAIFLPLITFLLNQLITKLLIPNAGRHITSSESFSESFEEVSSLTPIISKLSSKTPSRPTAVRLENFGDQYKLCSLTNLSPSGCNPQTIFR